MDKRQVLQFHLWQGWKCKKTNVRGESVCAAWPVTWHIHKHKNFLLNCTVWISWFPPGKPVTHSAVCACVHVFQSVKIIVHLHIYLFESIICKWKEKNAGLTLQVNMLYGHILSIQCCQWPTIWTRNKNRCILIKINFLYARPPIDTSKMMMILHFIGRGAKKRERQ